MRFNYLLSAVGLILIYIGFVLLVPISVALVFKEYADILNFLIPALCSIVCGGLFRFFANRISPVGNFNDIKKSEGLFIVVLTWVLFGGISAIPMMLMGLSPINALFEAASAIATVGVTLGITPGLCAASKVVLIVLMFLGRVGGMTIVYAALSTKHPYVSEFPQEKIMVG